MNRIHTKTIDAPEVATWLGGVVALAMHFAGQMELPPEALGAVMTAALLPVVMVVIRFGARLLSRMPGGDVSGEGGYGTLGAVGCLALLAVIWFAACGSTYHLDRGGWRLEAGVDGSACLHVFGDGSDVSKVCIKEPEPLRLPPATIKRICDR